MRLDARRVLRVLRRPRDVAALERQRVFLAEIDGRLPFATPAIEAIGPGGAWTIERRLPGTSLLVMLRRLGGSERRAALRSYAELVDAIGDDHVSGPALWPDPRRGLRSPPGPGATISASVSTGSSP